MITTSFKHKHAHTASAIIVTSGSSGGSVYTVMYVHYQHLLHILGLLTTHARTQTQFDLENCYNKQKI